MRPRSLVVVVVVTALAGCTARTPREVVTSSSVSDDTDTVTMIVPRGCLDEPRWIEAQVRAATMHYDAEPDHPRANAVWEDDAYAPALEQPSDRGSSPRLYHP